MEKLDTRQRIFTTRNMTTTALLTAISVILYIFIKFPLPFFPPFLDIQFSDMPALIGGFMMGPLLGSVIIVLKCCIKIAFGLSSTAFVGELADIFVGLAFVLPSAIIYRKMRTKKGAIISLVVGSLIATIVAMIANCVMLIPFYSKAFGWDAVVGMMTELFPGITRQNFYLYYLPLSILPFNILRCFICSVLTFFVYKGTEKLINRMISAAPKTKATQNKQPK